MMPREDVISPVHCHMICALCVQRHSILIHLHRINIYIFLVLITLMQVQNPRGEALNNSVGLRAQANQQKRFQPGHVHLGAPNFAVNG